MAFSNQLGTIGKIDGSLKVFLSNELVHLLSEQLYNSPLKAIEELVVNGFDADATNVRVVTPRPGVERENILVFDDGSGMNREDLANLWYIGRSRKRDSGYEARFRRKQIGRFGIGKLATYALAQLVTYVTKTQGGSIYSVTLNYTDFVNQATGGEQPVELSVLDLAEQQLQGADQFAEALGALGLDKAAILNPSAHWTLVVLENLRDRGSKLHHGRLKWVLQTAMPVTPDFHVFLDGAEIKSSKASIPTWVKFPVCGLPPDRLANIKKETDEEFHEESGRLVSKLFPSGISGEVIVAEQSLHTGKSVDLIRGNGFFVRVRDRLINEEDDLFGLHPLSHEVFNRFRADVNADDLDSEVRAGREALADTPRTEVFREVLNELFNYARTQYLAELKSRTDQSRKKEHERGYTVPRFAEEPVADALAALKPAEKDAKRTIEGFYIESVPIDRVDALIGALYSAPKRRFVFEYEEKGRADRLIRFNPETFTVVINAKHEFALANTDDGRATQALESIAAAEALLEAYLLNANLHPSAVQDILEKRDYLLRSLAKDNLYSLPAIAEALRDAAGIERDLEVALVRAFRALGFNTEHVSDSGNPDGIARYFDYNDGELRLTLEAKSSAGVPTLAQLDLAGCHDHMVAANAVGCVVLAPSFPGSTKNDNASVAVRAKQLGLSLWRVEDLARLVERAELRNVTAVQVLEIVRKCNSSEEVRSAIDALIEEPTWTDADLAQAVVDALVALQARLPGRERTVDMVASLVSGDARFEAVEWEKVRDVISALAVYSKGLLVLRGDQLNIAGSLDELRRRVTEFTGMKPLPRGLGISSAPPSDES